MVLGFLATIIASAIENAVVVGGVAALGAALYSLGVPKDSVLHYESAIKADSFLVMARGPAEEVARAKTILGATNPSRLDIHRDADVVVPAGSPRPHRLKAAHGKWTDGRKDWRRECWLANNPQPPDPLAPDRA